MNNVLTVGPLLDPRSLRQFSPNATSHWYKATNEQRAEAVIQWCEQHDIDVGSIMPRPLAAAMQAMPGATPEDFVRMIGAVRAYLGARL